MKLVNSIANPYGIQQKITDSMPCVCDVSYADAISNCHDYIIGSCKIAMTVHIPHTNSTGRKVKVIPDWD